MSKREANTIVRLLRARDQRYMFRVIKADKSMAGDYYIEAMHIKTGNRMNLFDIWDDLNVIQERNI